jgi:lysine 6-dehydrogenase
VGDRGSIVFLANYGHLGYSENRWEVSSVRFIVLGAGLQGVATAYDLLRNPATEAVTLADNDADKVRAAAGRLVSDKFETVEADCADAGTLKKVMPGHHVAVSALPYRLNLGAARAATECGVSFVDMGGNIETVLDELRLNQAASEAGVCLIPDCGLAPGLANVLVADAVAEMESVNDVAVRVGGLPAVPQPPWNYMLVFSFEGLLNEYTGKCAVLRDWNRTEVDALTGLEIINFPEPVGPCEAAFTSGGSSTLPWSFAGRVRSLDYKTVRYPGHYEKLQALAALGFFEDREVEVESVRVAPWKVLRVLAEEKLTFPHATDLVILRVESTGSKDGKPMRLSHEMMASRDEETGLTAMMRTTAFPTSIIAQMIACGHIDKRGAFPPEKVVPPTELIAELARRDILVVRTWENIDAK